MTTTLSAWIEGIGLRGPGLAGWSSSIDVLAGRTPYVDQPTVLTAPAALPPAERRRVGKGVKIALEVGFEAAAHAGRDAALLSSVFTSSSGDGDNCDAICRELTSDRLISPTRFHNSVHNAPSGYWGIASGSMEPSTSLCAYDDSFAAGLLDAMTQLIAGADAVLLVAYDAPYPEPLHSARPTPDSFGVALVLAREAGPRAIARIEIEALPSSSRRAASAMADAALEACRNAIPSARALPLLAAIAKQSFASTASFDDLVFDDVNGMHLRVRIHPRPQHQPVPHPRQPECA
jgi:Beta-ketoacyl synthase, N-terminal domain